MSEVNITNAVGVFPKTKFSMVLPEVEEKLKTLCGGNVRHVILCGIEVVFLKINYTFKHYDML